MYFGYIGAMVLATMVGLSLGALGSGGSIITTPILVYVAHIPPEHAVGMSLFIVGATSVVGAFVQMRRGNVERMPVLFFALTGMIGSFIGSSGTHLVSARALMLMFSSLMLVVGTAMWHGSGRLQQSQGCNPYKCLPAGFAVGILTGFLGVGGGFLIVPALVLFAGLETRKAIGTSLAVITLNSITGVLGQLRFERLDWTLVSGFLVFAIAGMMIGLAVADRIPGIQLRRIFAIAVVIVGAVVALQNLFP